MGLIEAINISHSFGDKILYKNASFELFKGEHMGIVGHNGTGKTTLLNSIAGEIIPDKGEVRIKKGIKNNLETDKNENTNYQNSWYAENAVLRRIFIVTQA